MSRTFAALALALMLLTGITVGQLVALASPSALNRTADATQQETLVTQHSRVAADYLAAINAVLATGDDQPLRQILADTFQSFADAARPPDDRARFIANLRRLAQIAPGMTLAGRDVVANDGLVALKLTAQSPVAAFAGMPLDAQSLLPPSEMLRIERGKVAERWSGPVQGPDISLLAAENLALPANGLLEPVMEEWTLTPEITYTPETIAGGTLLAPTTGTVTVAVSAMGRTHGTLWHGQPDLADGIPASEPVAAGTTFDIAPGDLLSLDAGARYTLRTNDEAAAMVRTISLVTAFSSQDKITVPRLQESDGLSRRGLAIGGKQLLPHGDLAMQSGFADLAPGASLPVHQAAATQFIFLLSGSLVIDQGDASSALPPRLMSGSQLPDQPGALVVEPGTSIGFHVLGDEPATIWVVSVTATANSVG